MIDPYTPEETSKLLKNGITQDTLDEYKKLMFEVFDGNKNEINDDKMVKIHRIAELYGIFADILK